MTVSVTVTQIGEDGTAGPVDKELVAALAGPVEQFSAMLTWIWRRTPGVFPHDGDREKAITDSGRELQLELLEATFTIDSAREERIEQVTSAAGIRHGSVETVMTWAWSASSGWSGSSGGPTATAAKRTCTRPMPGGCCPMTPTPSGCAPWPPITWPKAATDRPRKSSRPAPE